MLYQNLLCIQISACISESITYPIDFIKTTMQINQKKNNIHSIQNIIFKNKFNIYNGLKPSLLRHCFYSMIRIKTYEELNLKKKNNDLNNNIFYNKYLIAGFSGGLAQFISSPFDLLKIKYITNININKNKSLYKTSHNIYLQNGIKGLWKGVTPNVSRAILVNLGELSTYDNSKQYFKKNHNFNEGLLLHTSSSICSGFVSSVLCTPADVIKSRMMQENSPYKNIIHCISSTIRNEGISSFYKGFLPIWMRLGPWQIIFWTSYEKLRNVSGLESF